MMLMSNYVSNNHFSYTKQLVGPHLLESRRSVFIKGSPRQLPSTLKMPLEKLLLFHLMNLLSKVSLDVGLKQTLKFHLKK